MVNRLGHYQAVLRIGNHAVIGTGHTVKEAERETWKAAKERFADHSHVLDLLQAMGYQVEVTA